MNNVFMNFSEKVRCGWLASIYEYLPRENLVICSIRNGLGQDFLLAYNLDGTTKRFLNFPEDYYLQIL